MAAPWRARYVRSALRRKDCVFCAALRAGDDRKAYILHRARHAFIILNRFPYPAGHLMVAPYRHTADFARLSKAVSDEMTALLKLCVRILGRSDRPHGFNLGMNLGACAGAGVADHLHVHVVPRWPGDANFMPVLGDVSVLIEDLDASYDRLLPLFRRSSPSSAPKR
ncbi:MAG: HIT domain-containing protein [Candidatus Aminicenantes bacterium]|nr:HIT domain-containing protein [Candidatus Aminicenantes bacterium]